MNINNYNEERSCTYKNEEYLVRDNGAVYRKRKSKKRPLDEVWTFGNHGDKGYLYIASTQIHRIVATAFLGDAPEKNMVVDHIDTNKQNNRPENLRWLTREDNIMKNPYTIKKIEYITQKPIGEVIKNFSILHNCNHKQDNSWMRPVSEKEAENHQHWIERWNNKRTDKSLGKLGEWLFKTDPTQESLTVNAVQVKKWRVPTEFPHTPKQISDNPIQDYLKNLTVGSVFCKSNCYQSVIEEFALCKNNNSIVVKCSNSNKNSVKPFHVNIVTFECGKFVHDTVGSFFCEDGANKYFTIESGREWTGGDVFDDCVR